MPSLPLYDMSKKKIGSIEVDDRIFAADVKEHLIHDAVRYQIARRYELKTANCKTRSQVHGTGKKIYKQKGTGQARHGDAKAPIFVGGGKAHGPQPRRVVKKINKKVMRAALASVLSLRQKQDQLLIVEALTLPKHSARQVAQCLEGFGVHKALIVNPSSDLTERNFNQSTRNLENVKQLKPEGINVFDVLKYDSLIISKKALEQMMERFNNV